MTDGAHTTASIPEGLTALPGLIPPSGVNDPRRRVGDVIVELGFADRELVEKVMAREGKSRQLGTLLVESGIIDSSQLARALAERNSLDYVDLNVFDVDPGAANLIEAAEARRCRAIPVAFLGDSSLLVVSPDPSNVLGADDIAISTGYEVRRAIASPEGVEAVIGRLASLSGSVQRIEDQGAQTPPDGSEVLHLRASAEEAPVVKLVHAVIADATSRGASDIHFDPHRGDMRVRYRVDGVMLDSTTVPSNLVAGLVSRIKIMADLDIAERRIPQDGRVALEVDDRQVDIRISTLPVIHGESVVMRILDKGRVTLDLEALGMGSEDRELVLGALGQVQGAVLATGPTGTGKTTTLYAMLNAVNTPDKTLISIEDPVEYEVDGIKQIHVNPGTGMTFASGLRSMVRSDPDTLVVGEIRDRETAQVAMEAALTGHLILSTLHTNDAAIAAARMVEMGVEPFLIASGIQCVINQRLARRLCDRCKQPSTLAEPSSAGLAEEDGDVKVYEPVGCVSCGGTGYLGRIGLYEVLVLTDEVRALILERASSKEIEAAAVDAGMHRLRDDGLEKVRQGITSMPEVVRVLGTTA
jgi:type IV pilus assembly protein PilB